MAITERPRAFVYGCDVCGATHVQENAEGHYANSTPPSWQNVEVSRVGHDSGPGSDSRSYLLCESCRVVVVGEIMRTIDGIILQHHSQEDRKTR